MRLAPLLFASTCILAPTTAYAQAKAYGTSGMDRGQAGIARLQAQQAASANTIEAIAQCGNAGRMYGPGFAGAKSGNCPNNLTIRTGGGIAVSGGATIAGATTLSGTLAVSGTGTFGDKVTVSSGGLEVNGNTVLHGNFSVGGAATMAGAATIDGAATANGLVTANSGVNIHNGWLRVYGNYGINFGDHGGGWYMTDATWLRSYGNKGVYTGGNIRADGQFQVGTSVFGPPPVCNAATQKLYWNNGWSCKTTIGGTGAGEIDPKIGTLDDGRWCSSNGSQIICDKPAPTTSAFIAPPACNTITGKLRWTGTTWECVTDQQGSGSNDCGPYKNGEITNFAPGLGTTCVVHVDPDLPSGYIMQCTGGSGYSAGIKPSSFGQCVDGEIITFPTTLRWRMTDQVCASGSCTGPYIPYCYQTISDKLYQYLCSTPGEQGYCGSGGNASSGNYRITMCSGDKYGGSGNWILNGDDDGSHTVLGNCNDLAGMTCSAIGEAAACSFAGLTLAMTCL